MDQGLNTSQTPPVRQISSDKKYVVHTFGCKVNTYDSGLIQKNMSTHGFSLLQNVEKNKAEIHVLNTCAVTAEATKEAVRTIRKIKSLQPFSTIVVTGCSAQVDTGAFENLPGADLVVANSHKGLLPELLNKFFKGELKEKTFKSNIFKKEDLEMGGGHEQSHTRSFLKIQDGCNSFCTFCIIPYARGQSRSIPIADLVHRIHQLEKENILEVVLTGVHIGDYEDTISGQKKSLEDLVETILAKTKIPRIRLSSLEPIEVTDRLLDLYENPRLCPHFHMSIQSADTEVLKQMKRKYSAETVIESLKKIANRVPNVFMGMDVIAGFPTETEEQFENTYKNLAETPWTRLHVFPYSERSGTRAEVLPQIPFHVRKERAAKLRELSLHRFQSEGLKQIGTLQSALILNKPSKNTHGLTNHYWPVQIAHFDELTAQFVGREVPVRITGFDIESSEGHLIAELIETTTQDGLS
jgi:threonylcarbamoyladenosine tRNA methylthiotransferase MtaB